MCLRRLLRRFKTTEQFRVTTLRRGALNFLTNRDVIFMKANYIKIKNQDLSTDPADQFDTKYVLIPKNLEDREPGYYGWSKSIDYLERRKIIEQISCRPSGSNTCPNCSIPYRFYSKQYVGTVAVVHGNVVVKSLNRPKVEVISIGIEAGNCPHCDYADNIGYYRILKRKPLVHLEVKDDVNMFNNWVHGFDPEYECVKCNTEKHYEELTLGNVTYVRCSKCKWSNEHKRFFK